MNYLIIVFLALRAGSALRAPPRRRAARLHGADPRLDSIVEWSQAQSLQDVAPRGAVDAVLGELKEANWKEQKARYSEIFDKAEKSLREESRSLESFLGPNATASVLSIAERVGPELLDPQSVSAYLKQPSFEEIIGSVLYDAIFTFLERVDILGNIVNTLPIIGPLRQTINKELKKTLDQTLGRQIKTFLVDYNRVAIQRIADFALSPGNRAKFGSTTRNVVANLLKRPVKSLLPAAADTQRLKEKAWSLLVDNIGSAGGSEVLDRLYAEFGSLALGDAVQVDDVLRQSPALYSLISSSLTRLVESEQGKALVRGLTRED